jgi:plastocyanin
MALRSLAVAAAAALALGLTSGGLARPAAAKKRLVGTVGPGFTIKLTRKGKRVRTLKARTYTFVIHDKATIHNFELEKVKGGELEKEFTDVSFKGTKTARVKLTKGKYKYYCKPHESQMFGFFTVK